MNKKLTFIIILMSILVTSLASACPNVIYAYCDSNFKQIGTNTAETYYHGAFPECQSLVTETSAWEGRPEDTAYMVYGDGVDWFGQWTVGFYAHCKDTDNGTQCRLADDQDPNGGKTTWGFDGTTGACSVPLNIQAIKKPRTSKGVVTITRSK